MKVREVVGRFLVLTGLAAFLWSLWHMVDVGSCGGEYPPCPPGTGKYAAGLAYGIAGPVIGSVMSGAVGLYFLLGIPAVGVMFALKAFVDRDPGERAGMLTPAIIIGALFVLGVVALGRARGKQAKVAHLVQSGSRARGVLVGIRDTGVRINDDPRVELTVRIEPIDRSAPWEASKTMTVSEVAIPRQGDVFPVWYEPMSKDEWAIGIPTGTEPPDPALLREFGITAMPGGTPDLDDRVESLAMLADLRDRGALTDDEFEREKARLLGDGF